MKEGTLIRPARDADHPAILELWRAAGLPVKAVGRDAPAAFAVQRARFSTSYLVAEQGGQVVGVVLGTHDLRKGWINRLAVRPESRGQGLGRSLLSACEAALQAEGLQVIAATVLPDNDASRRFFEAAGWATQPLTYASRRPSDDA
jgi:ribosomal protein S18 acetylase RimI-like enzyme